METTNNQELTHDDPDTGELSLDTSSQIELSLDTSSQIEVPKKLIDPRYRRTRRGGLKKAAIRSACMMIGSPGR